MSKADFTPDVDNLKFEINRLNAQLTRANERVRELEQEKNKYFESLCMHAQRIPESDWSHNKDAVALLNKFAIEKKIEAINAVLDLGKLYTIGEVDQWAIDDAKVERFIEQLRKEQE